MASDTTYPTMPIPQCVICLQWNLAKYISRGAYSPSSVATMAGEEAKTYQMAVKK
jgi:hypothetical protein